MRRLRMFYPLEPSGAILTPIYTSNSGASTRTRLARPDICHDGRHMMAGYRLGSCCVSLRCSACLPVIMLRVLMLHDAAQLLLLLLLLLMLLLLLLLLPLFLPPFLRWSQRWQQKKQQQ